MSAELTTVIYLVVIVVVFYMFFFGISIRVPEAEDYATPEWYQERIQEVEKILERYKAELREIERERYQEYLNKKFGVIE